MTPQAPALSSLAFDRVGEAAASPNAFISENTFRVIELMQRCVQVPRAATTEQLINLQPVNQQTDEQLWFFLHNSFSLKSLKYFILSQLYVLKVWFGLSDAEKTQ